MDIPDLWEQAKCLLREDIGTSDWQLFTSFQSDASPKEVLESIKKGQDRAQDRYKTHSVTIMSKKFEFHVGRIMKKMRTICTMVDSGMVYAPESASIVWSAFRTLTRVIFQDQEFCELVGSTLDLMSEVVFVCDVHAHRILRAVDWRKQRSDGDLQTAPDTERKILEKIPFLYKIVLKFSFETTKLFPRDHEGNPKTKITRAVKAFFGKTDELSGLLDEAKSQLAQLHQMADIDFKIVVEDTVKETNLDMKEIKELWLPGIASEVDNISGELAKSREETELKRLDEECNKHLSWLQSGTSLALSQPKDQQVENLRNRSPHTCRWIFERGEYKDWKLATGKHTFWLSGPAGVGKSFLSSSVIEKLDSGDIDGKKPLMIFFFCKFGNDATQKGKKIMLHLLLQLFNEACNLGSRGKASSTDDGELKRACIKIVQEVADMEDVDRADDLEMSTMTQMFADIMEHLGRRIFVILDALDECVDWAPAEDESGLLNSLIDLTSKESSTSLFISSRVNGDIETALSIPRHRIQVDKSANEEDIGRFVDHELGQKKFDFLKKKAKENARNIILAKSEGMFQYAVIAIKTLDSARSKANFRRAVNQLPHGIYKLYARRFQDLEEEPRNHLRIILRWLLCAKTAIQAAPIVDEIGEYYSSEYEDDDDTDDDTDDDASDFDIHGWTPLLLAFLQQEQHILEMLSFFDTSDILAKLANIENAGIGSPPTAMWHHHMPFAAAARAEQPTTICVTGHSLPETVRANYPVPAGISRYYYEIFIERGGNYTQGDAVSFGLCSKFYSGAIRSRPFSGWMYCNDGSAFEDTRDVHCTEPVASFEKGDTVGVGVDFHKHMIFFTKNGEKLEGGFHGRQIKGRLFPFVHTATKDEGAHVRVNFGSEPFKYQWSL
ncbi:hypothetical protein HDK77DRAFT_481534 [Phyllosticta capitalensis]